MLAFFTFVKNPVPESLFLLFLLLFFLFSTLPNCSFSNQSVSHLSLSYQLSQLCLLSSLFRFCSTASVLRSHGHSINQSLSQSISQCHLLHLSLAPTSLSRIALCCCLLHSTPPYPPPLSIVCTQCF